MPQTALLHTTPLGLYCPIGDFYIDPWRPVPRAIVTHAHGDHARWGCDNYLVACAGLPVFRARLGEQSRIEGVPYREQRRVNGVTISLHPAGHILGSAQVRLEHQGEVWVVSGDYKTTADPTCAPFEPLPCHTFITESTFGLPIYRWRRPELVFAEIDRWWRGNAERGTASILLGYALGKAQRLLAGLDTSIGPIFCHGAVNKLNAAYRTAGVALPECVYAARAERKDWGGCLIVAPPSAQGTPWLRRFGDASIGIASGWMTLRGTRRRRAADRGFVLSDHADWPGLLWAIRETGAQRVLVTHGYTAQLVRYLRGLGLEAEEIATEFVGESPDEAAEPELDTEPEPEPEAAA